MGKRENLTNFIKASVVRILKVELTRSAMSAGSIYAYQPEIPKGLDKFKKNVK